MTESFRKERGKICTCKNRVKRKTVVITGANSGIGYEVALDLAKKGQFLFLTINQSCTLNICLNLE